MIVYVRMIAKTGLRNTWRDVGEPRIMIEHARSETAPRPDPARNSPSRVLVVEDDPYLRRVLVRTLEGWGFLISEAGDGGTAVDLATNCGSDLAIVLLDIMLPVMNGIEVARTVHRDRPNLCIVACSAAMNDEMRAELREVGVRYFLPKPYTADALKDVVRIALDSASQASSPQTE